MRNLLMLRSHSTPLVLLGSLAASTLCSAAERTQAFVPVPESKSAGGVTLQPAHARSYDPRAGNPITLLQSPKDAAGYYRTKVQVRVFVSEEKGAEAEPLAQELVREYPRDGEGWFLLARSKSLLKKHSEAAAAYLRAAEILGRRSVEFLHLPGQRFSLEPEAAASLLAAGDRRAALDLLRRSVFQHGFPFPSQLFHWSKFAALQSDPEFREITGRPDATGWSRADGLRRDIDLIYNTVKQVNPDYGYKPLPSAFVKRHSELKEAAPTLSDEEFFVEVNRLIAGLRQGHTWLLGFPAEHPSRRYLPVSFYTFPEGIFVIDAEKAYRKLIGSRLVKIENVAAEEALRQINTMQSVDGEMDYIKTGQELLKSVHVLKGLHIVDDVTSVALTLQKPGEKESKVVELGTVTEGLSSTLKPPPAAPAPLFVRKVAEAHWAQPLPEHDALYVQLNRVGNDQGETLEQFGVRLRTLLSEGNPDHLIIDMRHNGGGTTALYTEFLRTVIGFSQVAGHRVFVLIGRGTYSAAGNLITDLERLARPLFVGEPTSECCNFYGDANQVQLPYSKITGALTAVKWNLSHNVFDGRRDISPDLPVQLTAKQYFAGKDPALEAVFSMIHQAEHSLP